MTREKGRFWGERERNAKGECQHTVRVLDRSTGRYVWLNCTRGECNWCGSGRMWT
jgi:hypothetical protein